ncbi:hypothetical protein [Desulfovibrio litoralis]|uniref:SH3 domain-containing protein n=1 Tax=Desulfovibrio litoralis DSM 11393 TaxID=1121455 RepID=A0A1M7T8X9_9BACT|nr:hypothetical protein [Desulfovibrio litoralis]SHN67128.1 hypothetical protein SAMN02745728_01737 [Desulfovibrio litoralis DSM 11393]
MKRITFFLICFYAYMCNISVANDFVPLTLGKENTAYNISIANKNISIIRVGCSLYRFDGKNNILLGELMDGNVEKGCGFGAPDVLAADLTFDGRVEFFIKKSDGANIWYYLIDEDGYDGIDDIFETASIKRMRSDLEIGSDEQIWLSAPRFNRKEKSLEFYDKTGNILRITKYFLNKKRYSLHSDTYNLYSRDTYDTQSGGNKLIALEKVHLFENKKEKLVINISGSQPPVSIYAKSPVTVYKNHDTKSQVAYIINRDSSCSVIDAIIDDDDFLWLKIKDVKNRHGWVREDKTFFVSPEA